MVATTETDEQDELGVEEQEALLLDFAETTARPKHLAPNGKLYEIRNIDEFGLLEEHQLRADRERFSKLQAATKLTSTQGKQLEELLNSLFVKVVQADGDT